MENIRLDRAWKSAYAALIESHLTKKAISPGQLLQDLSLDYYGKDIDQLTWEELNVLHKVLAPYAPQPERYVIDMNEPTKSSSESGHGSAEKFLEEISESSFGVPLSRLDDSQLQQLLELMMNLKMPMPELETTPV